VETVLGLLKCGTVLLGVLFLGCCGGKGATDESFGDPVPPPKFLNGKVVGNTYYAVEGEFQIDLPHPASGNNAETYEWLHGQAKDGTDGSLKFVEFGPFAFDLNRYSVYVLPKEPGESVDAAARHWWDQTTGRGEFETLVQSGIDLDQKSAYYAAYRNTRQNYILVSTYIEFDRQFANIVAIVNPKSVFPVSEDDIKRREWKRYNNFIASLRISGVVPKTGRGKEQRLVLQAVQRNRF
jgi:hypothetical protein